MNIEQIQEMFPTKNEQRIAERILETLEDSPNLDVIQISEMMSPHKSPSAQLADCHGLNGVLTDLQALGIVVSNQDCFSLNHANSEALDLFCSLHKTKRNNPPADTQKPKYTALLCGYCGEIISTRGSFKSATCTKCGRKNSLGNTCEVLLKTNDSVELQSTVKQKKIQRVAEKKQINPDLKQI
jgi:hypothetical protein